MIMAKNNENRTILPEPTIRRLPWYLSYLRMLDSQHVSYVSSTQISKELNVQSSQIAKDLSFLNIRGKTRIGYEVSSLVSELEDFLGFNQQHNAVVIGTGSLVYNISELPAWQRENGVSIAILTVPVDRAQETAELAIASGMTALWNFTPYRIKTPPGVAIANTSIYAHLAIIYNRMQDHD